MFFHGVDIPALIYFPRYLLAQETAGITVMVYYAAVQEKKAGLNILKQPSPQASVTFIDDILMAFVESVKCMLFHGWADGI